MQKRFLGYAALTVSILLGGCFNNPYQTEKMAFEKGPKLKTISLEIGKAHYTSIYNVSEPTEIAFLAPKGYAIKEKDELKEVYKTTLVPQEPLRQSFTLIDKKSKKTKDLEAYVQTYKLPYFPPNQQAVMEGYRNDQKLVGYSTFNEMQENQDEITVDLHEHDRIEENYFIYYYPFEKIDEYQKKHSKIKIKLLAPRYSSFVLKDGKLTKEYDLSIAPTPEVKVMGQLKHDATGESYKRIYAFNFEMGDEPEALPEPDKCINPLFGMQCIKNLFNIHLKNGRIAF